MTARQNATSSSHDLFEEIVHELQAAEVFFGHGAASAEEETLWLLAHVLKKDPQWVNAHPQVMLTTAQEARLKTLLHQRITRRLPMGYITGTAYFAGHELIADRRALIPRSPFAELIEKRFQPWLGKEQPQRMLDMCTGGGCIAIAMASVFPQAQVDAVDVSADALSLAAENRHKHKLDSRLHLIQSDLFQAVNGRYDVIASNPPYVSVAEYRQLPDEYRHEPPLGLVSEGDGLCLPLEILVQAAGYMTDDGLLFLEVGHSDEALQAALPNVPITWLLFEQSGSGICVFSREELLNYQAEFSRALKALTDTPHES